MKRLETYNLPSNRAKKTVSDWFDSGGTMKAPFLLLILFFGMPAAAVELQAVLFENVRVWDGRADDLTAPTRVLVVGDEIVAVTPDNHQVPASVSRIDGGGRTLMPGLIDAHVHINIQFLDSNRGVHAASNMTWEEIGARAREAIDEFLPSGFTTVRDLCGTGVGLRKLIDSGFIEGPRMYISGACIGQSSGHTDFRSDAESLIPSYGNTYLEKLGITILADGADQVLKATRNNLARGADFVKMVAGGGVSSDRDPLHTIQGTMDELRAMVTATRHFDTYSAVHAYHDESVRRALNAGVRSIEHGNLMTDPETFRMVDEKDAWIVPAMGGFAKELMEHPYYGNPANPAHLKAKQIYENGENWVSLARRHRINMGFGTDVVLVNKLSSRNLRDYQITQWAKAFGNLQTLKAMTSDNGRLMALAGKNNPYPKKLGAIEPGAYADLLLVDGNPLEDVSVIGAAPSMFKTRPRPTPDVTTIRLVMKNGKIYKNTL